MSNLNAYPAPQTPLSGTEAIVGAQTQSGVVKTVTITLDQVSTFINGGSIPWIVAGGTADAITATYAPPLTSLADGQLCWFRAAYANATTTPTFSPNGLAPHPITERGGSALQAGNIPGAGAEVILRYNLANTRWEMLNPDYLTALAASSGSSLVSFLSAVPGASSRTMQSKERDIVSVMDMPGIDPTGATDSTAAFNLATQSTAPWSTSLEYDVFVPAGVGYRFKIDGTVYIRKGQTLRGSGRSYIDASGSNALGAPIFQLGHGTLGADSSGQPAGIEGFFILGGPTSNPVVICDQPGYFIQDMFFSSPDIGLQLSGADGLVNNIEIDQSLTAVLIKNAQNLCINNCNIYVSNFAITISDQSYDVTWTNSVIEYPVYNGVLFSNGVGTTISGIMFSNVDFIMNTQYSTFLGYIRTVGSNIDAQFTGCSFRNWYEAAIYHDTNGPVTLAFSGCVFDGNKTQSLYTQSTTAKVLVTGLYGTYTFDGCQFRNLLGTIADVNDNLTKLNIIGGSVVNCPETRFNFITTEVPDITVKGVTGFGFLKADSTHQSMVLPWWGASTIWKVTVKGNNLATGSLNYSRSEEGVYTVTFAYSGTALTLYFDKILLWTAVNRATPPDLGAVVCNGNVPGGATSTTTFAASGKLCISVPVSTADAANFAWYAETGT